MPDTNIIEKIDLNGVEYQIKDNISGYTTNTGTVTSVSAGTGLTGGSVTTSGSLSLDTTRAVSAADIITGTDTNNKLISAKTLSDVLSGLGRGTVTSVDITNGGGLTVSGGPITSSGSITVGHTNSVIPQTTQAIYPIKIDAQGHISGYGSAVTSMTPTSHTHGNITNDGDITTNAVIASGDRLVINDESASKLTNSSITFGTSTTQFLANNGTWQTPVGGVTDVKVNNTSVLSSGVANLVTNTAYNASTNKIATMADVDVVTITYSLISGTDYEMNISTVLAPNYANTILGEEY